MKVFRVALWLFVVVAIGIQFVPVDRTNPPVLSEVTAPPEVMETLRTACYDCHSNETVWPWYSRVAPVSWRIAEHVRMAREELNFSSWGELSLDDQEHLLEEIWEEVDDGAMPLPDYLRMHPEAVLTEAQRETLRRWSQGLSPQFPDWE